MEVGEREKRDGDKEHKDSPAVGGQSCDLEWTEEEQGQASLKEIRGNLRSKEEELNRIKIEMSYLRKEKQMLESSWVDRDRRSSQMSTCCGGAGADGQGGVGQSAE